MRASALLPLLGLACALAACRGAQAPAAPSTPPATARHALVRFDVPQGTFPGKWHRPGVAVRATALARDRQPQADAWLAPALAKYPPGFLAEHLRGIHVLEALSFRGVRAGGSNSKRRIYVVLPRGHAAQIYFERVVHAEISSVLLRRYRGSFDSAAWLRGTIPGFRYGASGAAAVRHGVANTWPTDWALKQGFLYEYGMSSLENDVNSYAGFVFTHPDRLRDFAARYPGVAHKRAQVLAFYRSLDPDFAAISGPAPSTNVRR